MEKSDLQKVRDALVAADRALLSVRELNEALRILDAALAAPEPQQPVAWMGYSGVGEKIVSPKAIYSWMTTPLYTAPVPAPQREWVGLEAWERAKIIDEVDKNKYANWLELGVAKAIESALRAKNEVKNHG